MHVCAGLHPADFTAASVNATAASIPDLIAWFRNPKPYLNILAWVICNGAVC